MKTISPEKELELDLQYRLCLKCKDRCEMGRNFIDVWEDREVRKYHGRDIQGYEQ